MLDLNLSSVFDMISQHEMVLCKYDYKCCGTCARDGAEEEMRLNQNYQGFVYFHHQDMDIAMDLELLIFSIPSLLIELSYDVAPLASSFSFKWMQFELSFRLKPIRLLKQFVDP